MNKTSITGLSGLFGNVLNTASQQFDDLTNTVKNSMDVFSINNSNLFTERGESKSGLTALTTPIQGQSIVSATGDEDHEIIVGGTNTAIDAGLQGSSLNVVDTLGQPITLNTDKEKFMANSARYKEQVNIKNPTNSGVFMLDFGEYLTNNLLGNITKYIDRPVAPLDFTRIFQLILAGRLDQVLPILIPYINKPETYEDDVNNLDSSLWSDEVIETNRRITALDNTIKSTDVSLTSYVSDNANEYDSVGINSRGVINSNSKTGKRMGRATTGQDWNFDDINSNEELESLFRDVDRAEGNEITGATIHWSATFIDQNIDAEWLNRVHIEKGYDGIGYHIVIRRDGTLQRGRPLNIEGAHDRNNNINFLGFCFVGGINEFAKTARKPYWQYASANSLTLAQFKGYNNLMRTFHKVFPYAQVVGHYDTSTEGKLDPGFDVIHYSRNTFGHNNIIPEGDTRWSTPEPITLKDLT